MLTFDLSDILCLHSVCDELAVYLGHSENSRFD